MAARTPSSRADAEGRVALAVARGYDRGMGGRRPSRNLRPTRGGWAWGAAFVGILLVCIVVARNIRAAAVAVILLCLLYAWKRRDDRRIQLAVLLVAAATLAFVAWTGWRAWERGHSPERPALQQPAPSR